MPANQRQVKAYLARLLAERNVDQMERQLAPKVRGRPTRNVGALHADAKSIDAALLLIQAITPILDQPGWPERLAYARATLPPIHEAGR